MFLHIVLATSLFLSTSGLKVSWHYCNDQLSGLALFVEAADCKESSCCEEKPCCSSDKDKDCHNDNQYYKADIDQIQVKMDLSQDIQFAYVSNLSFEDSSELNKTNNGKILLVRPPPRHRDPIIEFQSFLC